MSNVIMIFTILGVACCLVILVAFIFVGALLAIQDR